MKELVSATIEEFEQGRWVAELTSLDKFDGSFTIGDVTWTGTSVADHQEDQKYFTRVVGGADKLGVSLLDKYYNGNVTLQAVLQDICKESGETFGSAQVSVFFPAYQRLLDTAYAALDKVCDAVSMIWWIARDGGLHVQPARDVAPLATGFKVEQIADCAVLAEPTGVIPGATFDGKTIRHVRWEYSPEHFRARCYFIPFLQPAPVRTIYDCMYDARVDRDNGDGTIDVIAGGRFGVTKVRLLSGVPASKIKVKGGEEVTLGFFGGDPRLPFAVAMGQDLTALKQVARNGDSVKITIPAGTFIGSVGGSGTAVPTTQPIDFTGVITSGTERIKVGD